MIIKILLLSFCVLCTLFVVLSKSAKVQVSFFTIFHLCLSATLYSEEMKFIALTYGFASSGLSLVLIMFFMVPREDTINVEMKWQQYVYKAVGAISAIFLMLLIYGILRHSFALFDVTKQSAGFENEMISQLFNEYYFPFGFLTFFILAVTYSLVAYIKGKE